MYLAWACVSSTRLCGNRHRKKYFKFLFFTEPTMPQAQAKILQGDSALRQGEFVQGDSDQGD